MLSKESSSSRLTVGVILMRSASDFREKIVQVRISVLFPSNHHKGLIMFIRMLDGLVVFILPSRRYDLFHSKGTLYCKYHLF
jgi:hypothetical protein